MTAEQIAAGRSCAGCAHADGIDCLRDLRAGRRPFRQSYETKYADDDFCGPDRRYWIKVSSYWRRLGLQVRAILKDQDHGR